MSTPKHLKTERFLTVNIHFEVYAFVSAFVWLDRMPHRRSEKHAYEHATQWNLRREQYDFAKDLSYRDYIIAETVWTVEHAKIIEKALAERYEAVWEHATDHDFGDVFGRF